VTSLIRLPSPLLTGGTIGITAPSSGVAVRMRARFDACVQTAQELGYSVRIGKHVLSESETTGTAAERAAELESMMLDPSISAVVPPWGGELLIQTLQHLDFDRLAASTPKWFAGWSDCTTFMLPLLLRSNIMSLHGQNFMDLPMQNVGIEPWFNILSASSNYRFTQSQLPQFAKTWKSYVEYPTVSRYEVDTPTCWRLLGAERDVRVSGRLVGGCVDVLTKLVGTPYGDVPAFVRKHADEGVIVYLEVSEANSFDVSRSLHQFLYAGWFDSVNAVLLGRSSGPDAEGFSQHDAVADALSSLSVPVLYDLDFGHRPPQHLLVNGAVATVQFGSSGNFIEQTLR
jgi:muramoyltetrapeptide carboxypeptidase